MAGRWLSAAAILMLICGLLLPVTAAQGEEGGGPRFTGFHLRATNGFLLNAYAVALPGDEEGDIGILVYGKRASVSYWAPATVTATTIEANLGLLGRISVTRQRTGRMKTVPGCKPGSRKQVPADRYEGTIEFHGEEGFTEVSATSAPLDVLVPCVTRGGDAAPPGPRLPGARIDLEKRYRGGSQLEFTAAQRRPGGLTGLQVELDERRGEIAIERTAWAFASAGALRYDRDLRTATLRPPAPFAGHATFDRGAPRARQWTGNLTVDMPGRSDVPLTGRGFWVDLERPRG